MAKGRPRDADQVDIFLGIGGYRYTCRKRDEEGKLRVVYDSERAFRTVRHARKEIDLYWPEAKVYVT